jgi:hypothetical protein
VFSGYTFLSMEKQRTSAQPMLQVHPNTSVLLTLDPLVELLRRELDLAGLPLPAIEPSTVRTFTLWYLEAVQSLEGHCAKEEGHPAMKWLN